MHRLKTIRRNIMEPQTVFFWERKASNLTSIKWAHAVNSISQLEDALNSDVDMIEADILLGNVNENDKIIPIMAHPPEICSDLSLKEFLQRIKAFNEKCSQSNVKGAKLDFKSIEAFEKALETEKTEISQMSFPIWLNADIVQGELDIKAGHHVDADRFLAGCLQLPNAVLSLGWTTNWFTTQKNGCYTRNDMEAMISCIQRNDVTSNHDITFPVRAGIAANSVDLLQYIICRMNKTNRTTLTIWSSSEDHVDVSKLAELINLIGLHRVYLDIPETLSKQLKTISNKNLK